MNIKLFLLSFFACYSHLNLQTSFNFSSPDLAACLEKGCRKVACTPPYYRFAKGAESQSQAPKRVVRKRKISVDEYQFALSLFPREFPTRDEITITDDVSPANGAKYVRPTIGILGGEGYIRMNMGDKFADCLSDKSLFAHELTHVWQIEHFGVAWYTKEFLNNQVFCSGDAYAVTCVAGKKLGDYNAEQQAVLVSQYFNHSDACAMQTVNNALGTDTWHLMIGSDGRDVSINGQGSIFLTNNVGKIYRYNQKEWVQMPGSDGLSIAANANRVILVNTSGEIFEWKSNAWEQLSGSSARDVAITSNGALWMVNSVGKIYKRDDKAWKEMPGSDARRIAAGGGQVWMLNSAGFCYKFDDSTNTWSKMSGSDGRDIAISNDGKIFLTNTAGLIYQWKHSGWVQLDGSSGGTLSANQGKLIMVNTAGRIFYRSL